MGSLAAGQAAQNEVKLDRTVVLRHYAPSAKEVRVTGTYADGAKAMTKDADGVWSATLGPLQPGVYKYALTVDGLRVLSPGFQDGSAGQFEVKDVHVQRPAR